MIIISRYTLSSIFNLLQEILQTMLLKKKTIKRKMHVILHLFQDQCTNNKRAQTNKVHEQLVLCKLGAV